MRAHAAARDPRASRLRSGATNVMTPYISMTDDRAAVHAWRGCRQQHHDSTTERPTREVRSLPLPPPAWRIPRRATLIPENSPGWPCREVIDTSNVRA